MRPVELRLILGDQLNAGHSWFREKRPDVLYVIAELRSETDYTTHHIQKICGFFLAMARFADALEQAGHRVLYLSLDDTRGISDFGAMLDRLIARYQPQCVSYQQPDEYRVSALLAAWCEQVGVATACVDSEHFLLAYSDLPNWLPAQGSWRMEWFYRAMRKQQNVLMQGDTPVGGQWNFDKENRQPLGDQIQIPEPLCFDHDVTEIMARLQRHQISTIGNLDTQHFTWPVTRQESRTLLTHFIEQCLPSFGTYQDALSEAHWSLYHSRLSFSLNTKMLHPLEVIRAAESAYHTNEAVSIAQAEGFIRQILGWREYVRGVYWQLMPDYASVNALQAKRPLPGYFWHAKTRMSCMRSTIQQSLDFAYAHHIQRLMVTGNFCLLAGIAPDQVHAWYLGIYIDALEWVEMPNTLGMSQYADGGKLASKPYAAGGNYLNKMGDYCRGCHYDVKKRYGEGSCPFNVLYWHFLNRNRAALSDNPRLRMIYRQWDKRSQDDQSAVLLTAASYLERLDAL